MKERKHFRETGYGTRTPYWAAKPCRTCSQRHCPWPDCCRWQGWFREAWEAVNRYAWAVKDRVGRDQNGVLHRTVVRYKVASWSFRYESLTEEERQYLEGLFPREATFAFGHPSREDASVQEVTECYRSKYGISWRNARTGLWKGCRFTVIEV